ncbi:hypothetical protein LCGC14_2431850 [marine sediment metagenome]
MLKIPIPFKTHSGQNKLDALKVFREGKVKLVHLTNNQIAISFAANLNYLLAISFISRLTVLLVGLYYFEDIIKINLVLIIIAIVLIVLIIGMNTKRKEINEIIDHSIKIK